MYLSYIRIFFTYILALLSGVVQCGRRLTDLNTLAALAAAEQRRQQLHSTREDRRARALERTRVQHLAQHFEQQSQPGIAKQHAPADQRRQQLHSTREDRRAQAYGAQAFRGAV